MHLDRRRFCIGTGLALLTLACAWQADAAKPAFSISTKLFEGSVTIEDALKASPGLFNDCLSEGRAWVEKTRAQAEQSHREDPKGFAQGQQWDAERTYEQRSLVANRYVSVVRTDSMFAGGAHPNTLIDTILWDRKLTRRVSVRPFFTDTADNGPTMTALAQLVRLAVAVEKIARRSDDSSSKSEPKQTPEEWLKDDTDIQNGVSPTLLKLGPITPAPSTEAGKSSGLTFHFSPYAVGSYAEGPYVVFVPWTKFRQYLSAEGSAIFAGDRPDNDDSP